MKQSYQQEASQTMSDAPTASVEGGFSQWDRKAGAIAVIPGPYEIAVGRSSRDLRLTDSVTFAADDSRERRERTRQLDGTRCDRAFRYCYGPLNNQGVKDGPSQLKGFDPVYGRSRVPLARAQ